jgi:hypothetical protein
MLLLLSLLLSQSLCLANEIEAPPAFDREQQHFESLLRPPRVYAIKEQFSTADLPYITDAAQRIISERYAQRIIPEKSEHLDGIIISWNNILVRDNVSGYSKPLLQYLAPMILNEIFEQRLITYALKMLTIHRLAYTAYPEFPADLLAVALETVPENFIAVYKSIESQQSKDEIDSFMVDILLPGALKMRMPGIRGDADSAIVFMLTKVRAPLEIDPKLIPVAREVVDTYPFAVSNIISDRVSSSVTKRLQRDQSTNLLVARNTAGELQQAHVVAWTLLIEHVTDAATIPPEPASQPRTNAADMMLQALEMSLSSCRLHK